MDPIAAPCIFIGGTGRSGTNITKTVLAAHPDVVALPFEHRFTIDPDGVVDCFLGLRGTWSPFVADSKVRRLERLLNRVSRRRPMAALTGRAVKWLDSQGRRVTPPAYFDWELKQWFPNFDEHVKELLDALQEFSYRGAWPGAEGLRFGNRILFVHYGPGQETRLVEIFRSFLRGCISDLLKQRERSLFVEDNTWNLLFADTLGLLLPEARFVEVIRDPRDVVASLLQQRWSPDDLMEVVVFFQSLMCRQREQLALVPDERVFRLRLEDLVEDPDCWIRKISDFAGVDVTKSMSRIDLSHGHLGRWKTDFKAKEALYLRESLREEIHAGGYKP